jgi:hypothetical protein
MSANVNVEEKAPEQSINRYWVGFDLGLTGNDGHFSEGWTRLALKSVARVWPRSLRSNRETNWKLRFSVYGSIPPSSLEGLCGPCAERRRRRLMARVCIDAGFLIGLYDASNEHHQTAKLQFADIFSRPA